MIESLVRAAQNLRRVANESLDIIAADAAYAKKTIRRMPRDARAGLAALGTSMILSSAAAGIMTGSFYEELQSPYADNKEALAVAQVLVNGALALSTIGAAAFNKDERRRREIDYQPNQYGFSVSPAAYYPQVASSVGK